MFDNVVSGVLGGWRSRLGDASPPDDPGELIDLIRALEDLKSCASAVQAKAASKLDGLRRAAEEAEGVPADSRGKGVAAEIAFARRESPHRGARFLGMAKALTREMPGTLDSLAAGRLNEWRAMLAVRETACLSVDDRAAIDRELAGHLLIDPALGDRKLVGWIRKRAYAKDPESVVRRAARAESERAVTLRPAPDTMTWLSALLPVTQGVAIYGALTQAADTARAEGDGRSRGQVMADTLVERVTACPPAMPVKVELVVEITDRALFDVTSEPAYVQGHGWVPAGWVRRLIAHSEADGKVALRRLFRGPGGMIQLETDSRIMTAGMRRIIALRDQTCRRPWCDAPIRHADHVVERADGGETSIDNGQGLCEACNYAKSALGWQAKPGYAPDGTHVVEITTPTGHVHRSQAPPGPGRSSPEPGGL